MRRDGEGREEVDVGFVWNVSEVKCVEVREDVEDWLREDVLREGIMGIVVGGSDVGDDGVEVERKIVGDVWKGGGVRKWFVGRRDGMRKDSNERVVVLVGEIFEEIVGCVEEVDWDYDSGEIGIN